MSVGVIGLGAMGAGIAANLVRAGMTVVGHDVAAAARGAAADSGVRVVDGPAEVAAASTEAVVVVVRTAEQTVEVVDGIVGAAPDGLPVVLASTLAPSTVRDLADRLGAAGLHTVSAALSGGPWGAAAGTLTFMVSGPAAAVRRCTPLFDAAGSRTYVVSDRPEVAPAAKLAVQLIYGVNMMGLFEAFRLGAEFGVDHDALGEIFQHSVADSWVARNWPHVREWWQTQGNGLDILLKDMRATLREADDRALSLPTTALTFDLMRSVWTAYGDDFPPLPGPAPDPVAWT